MPNNRPGPLTNSDGLLRASASQGPSTENIDFENISGRGLILYLNITAETGTATLNVKVQRKDPVSGTYFDIPGASFAAKTATGSDMLCIYPGAVAVANQVVNQIVGRNLRVVAVESGGGSTFTWSLGVGYAL